MKNLPLLLLAASAGSVLGGCQSDRRVSRDQDRVVLAAFTVTPPTAQQRKEIDEAPQWAAAITPQTAYDLWEKNEPLIPARKLALRRRVRNFSEKEAAIYVSLFSIPDPPSFKRVLELTGMFHDKPVSFNYAKLSDEDMVLLEVFPQIRKGRFVASDDDDGQTFELSTDGYDEEASLRQEQIEAGSEQLRARIQTWAEAFSFQDMKKMLGMIPAWSGYVAYAEAIGAPVQRFSDSEMEEFERLSFEKMNFVIVDLRDGVAEGSTSFKVYADIMQQKEELSKKEGRSSGSDEFVVSAAGGRNVSSVALDAVLKAYRRCRPLLEKKFGKTLPGEPAVTLDFDDKPSWALTIDGGKLLVGRRIVTEMFFAAATQTATGVLGELDPRETPGRYEILGFFSPALEEVKFGGRRGLDEIFDRNTDIAASLMGMLSIDKNFLSCLEFAFAHELGHQVLGPRHLELPIEQRELEADKFAVVLVASAYLELLEKQQKQMQSLGSGIEISGVREMQKGLSDDVAEMFDEMLGTKGFLVHTGRSVERQLGASDKYGYPSLDVRREQALSMFQQAVLELTAPTPVTTSPP